MFKQIEKKKKHIVEARFLKNGRKKICCVWARKVLMYSAYLKLSRSLENKKFRANKFYIRLDYWAETYDVRFLFRFFNLA
jgi:hypothetical protein